MKGMIFTAFLDHVETTYDAVLVEKMLAACDLSTGGAYTSVGTYDHSELVQMLVALSELTGESIPDMLRSFGTYLFPKLALAYSGVVEHAFDSFSLILTVHDQIHVEVRKLYPDADLPHFAHELINADHMVLTYRSERGLADLAEGLLIGCFDHFGDSIRLGRKDLSDGAATHVQFEMIRDRQSDG